MRKLIVAFMLCLSLSSDSHGMLKFNWKKRGPSTVTPQSNRYVYEEAPDLVNEIRKCANIGETPLYPLVRSHHDIIIRRIIATDILCRLNISLDSKDIYGRTFVQYLFIIDRIEQAKSSHDFWELLTIVKENAQARKALICKTLSPIIVAAGPLNLILEYYEKEDFKVDEIKLKQLCEEELKRRNAHGLI